MSHIMINLFNFRDKVFFRHPAEKAKGKKIQGASDFSPSLPHAREQ